MGKYSILKEAIMYANQKPEVLAKILADNIDDEAKSIVITGADSITIPSSDSTTSTYTAIAFSQFDEEMSDAVTLAIKETTTGVSITSGVVTVDSTATSTSFIIKATIGNLTKEKEVSLVQESAS